MSKTKRRTPQPASRPAARVEKDQPPRPVSTKAFFWAGIVLFAISLIARLRLLGIPFERDEGAFAYIGRALWGPARLYTELYDNKLPGLYLIYALFARVFGVLPADIHLGALLWQIAGLAVFFLWLREVVGRDRAAACTGLYALYAASGEVLGFAAHATQLTALPAFAGLWALWRGAVQQRGPQWAWLFLAGLGAGTAFWIKQQAFFYALFGGLLLCWQFFGKKSDWPAGKALGLLALYVFGAILPVGLSAAWFAAQGRFDDFWFWTIQMSAGQSIESAGGWYFFKYYFPKVAAHWWLVWLAGVAGLILLFRQKDASEQRAIAALLPLALLSTAIGGAFYPHYFVLVLPWLAFCAVAFFDILVRRLGLPGLIISALVLLWPVVAHFGYWFREDHQAILRRAYAKAPFPEMETIGAELQRRSSPGDQVAVIGSEPELFLYANRPSALGPLFFQAVVQPNARREAFQAQVRREFFGSRPRFVVLPGDQFDQIRTDPLVQEIVDVLHKDYRVIGVADIYDKRTNLAWDPRPEQAQPQTMFWVLVLERNAGQQ